MMKHKLFSTVLVIITVLITNFSFALIAKDAFAPALDNTVMMENTMHNTSAHMNHHANDNAVECEVHCNALMMSCALGISNFNSTELSYSHAIIKKLNIFSDDALYSVDLIQDHKPPIFS